MTLQPIQNGYDQQAGTNFFNCMFDPVDDGTTEDDFFDPTDPARSFGPSSTCFPAFSYACMGDTFNTFNANDLCFANTPPAQSDAPNLGNGTWVETVVDLSEFRGRRVKLRYIVTSIKATAETHEAQFAPFNPIPNDDGWWVDDVRVSDTLDMPAQILNDQYDLGSCTGSGASCIGQCSITLADCGPDLAACPMGNTCLRPCLTGQTCTLPPPGCGEGCMSVEARVVAETESEELTNPTTIGTAAPGQIISLNAADPSDPSTADSCLNGTLQFRFCISGDPDGGGPGLPDDDCEDTGLDEILRGWTENPTYTDSPQASGSYVTEVRCSTLGSCADSQQIDVVVACPGKGGSSVNALGLADIRASETCVGGGDEGETCVDTFDCDSGICGGTAGPGAGSLAQLTWSGEPLAVDTWKSGPIANSFEFESPIPYDGATTNFGALVTSMDLGLLDPPANEFFAYLVKANGPTNHVNEDVLRCSETDLSCEVDTDCPGFYCSSSGAVCEIADDCPLFGETCDRESCFPVQIEGYYCNSVTWRSGGLAEVPEYPGTPAGRDSTLLDP
jgi:hypothetical protein